MSRFSHLIKPRNFSEIPTEWWIRQAERLAVSEELTFELIYADRFQGKNRAYGEFVIKGIKGIEGDLLGVFHNFTAVIPFRKGEKLPFGELYKFTGKARSLRDLTRNGSTKRCICF